MTRTQMLLSAPEDIKINQKEMLATLQEVVEPVALYDEKGKKIPGYMGIKNLARHKVVSIVPDTYCILPNQVVIEPVLNYFERKNIKWELGRLSHVTDTTIRLQFNLPDYKIEDDTKQGLIMSLDAANSYDMHHRFSMAAGAYRVICKNGMVVGVIVQRVRIIHQAHKIQEIVANKVDDVIREYLERRKEVQRRITEMINTRVTGQLLRRVVAIFTPRVSSYVFRQLSLMGEDQTNTSVHEIAEKINPQQKFNVDEWVLYNSMTSYISHVILQRYRLDMLSQMSRVFAL